MKKLALLPVLAALALTGCSTDSEPTSNTSPAAAEAAPSESPAGDAPSEAYLATFDECMKNWSEGAASLSGGKPEDYLDNKENIEVCEGIAALEDLPAGGAPAGDAPAGPAGDASALVNGDDFFFVSSSNTIGKFTLPTEPEPEVEALRKASKGDPVSYALVQIDNREGMDYANMYALNVYGADGAKYEFSSVDDYLDEWADNVERTVENNGLNADLTDAINHHQEGVDAGMVGEIWMATEGELPDEFSQITVEVHGAGTPDYAVSSKDSQGVDLSFVVPAKNKK